MDFLKMSTPVRICLVSPFGLSMNPRLVKEADALSAAGHEVQVIAARLGGPLGELDADLAASAKWKLHLVDLRKHHAAKLLARFALALSTRLELPGLSLPARAVHFGFASLKKAALQSTADLYIGHCLGGLAPAALAAAAHKRPFAFDAEDHHPTETLHVLQHRGLARATALLLGRALPQAAHLTAASPLIARAYADDFGLPQPRVILNVFPLSMGPLFPRPARKPGAPAKLYWFSQHIGSDRGLGEIMPALALMRHPCELHLRGQSSQELRQKLSNTAAALGFKGGLFFHQPAPPSEMARLAAEHDLGLSLELQTPPNRDLCLTNKIFTYLLAGIPVLLSPTRAQKDLATSLGMAGILVDSQNPANTAARLDSLFLSPNAHAHACQQARDLAFNRYNWDKEAQTLLSIVGQSLKTRQAPLRP